MKMYTQLMGSSQFMRISSGQLSSAFTYQRFCCRFAWNCKWKKRRRKIEIQLAVKQKIQIHFSMHA